MSIKRSRLWSLLRQTRGMGLSLWLLVLGVILFLVGSALSFQPLIKPFLEWLGEAAYRILAPVLPPTGENFAAHLLGGFCLIISFVLLLMGIRRMFLHLMETIDPTLAQGNLGEIYLRRRKLAQGPKIVAIGGGTGLSTLLRGLKAHSSNITAIVTVTDDGGSSGRLRQDLGIIPPGDIRSCLAALADSEKTMADLFQYRFKGAAGSLSGHALGNLLIAALVDQAGGDFDQALESASKVLTIVGRVMPSTTERVGLKALLADGSEVTGESKIASSGRTIRRVFLDPPGPAPHAMALEAIAAADIIVIGPGSVYTSVIPNLLIPGIADEIKRSKAVKVYVCNVMTEAGESDSMGASEHVTAVQVNVARRVFDYVMVNTTVPSPSLLERYQQSGQHFVTPDPEVIRSMGFHVVPGDFISETNFVRHDPAKIASRLMRLLQKH